MKIDVRGLSCPQPAIELNNALSSQPESLEVVCDTSTPLDNLLRMAKKNDYELASKEEQGLERILHFTKH